MLKIGDRVEIRIRGTVMEEEISPNSAIRVDCDLMRPSIGRLYSTFVLSKDILPLSAEGQEPQVVKVPTVDPLTGVSAKGEK